MLSYGVSCKASPEACARSGVEQNERGVDHARALDRGVGAAIVGAVSDGPIGRFGRLRLQCRDRGARDAAEQGSRGRD